MLPKYEVMELYNSYKAKYNELKGKDDNDMGYVTERAEIKRIMDLLKKILQLNDGD